MTCFPCPACRNGLRLDPQRMDRPSLCPTCRAELRPSADGFLLERARGSSVLWTGELAASRPLVRDALARALGWSPLEAHRAVERAEPWGVLAEGLDADLARGLVEALAAIGVATRLLATPDVPRMPRPSLVRQLAVRPARLALVDSRGESSAQIAAGDVRLLCPGEIWHRPEGDVCEPRLELWIVSAPPTRSWRLIHGAFQVEGLAEVRPRDPLSFKRLLAGLAAALPSAGLTESFGSCLRAENPGCHRFGSLESFEGYVRREWARAQLEPGRRS